MTKPIRTIFSLLLVGIWTFVGLDRLAMADDQASPPSVSYWHVWTDNNGVSHQTREKLTSFELKSIEPPAAPQWLNRLTAEGASVVVTVLPVGWVGQWHENPKAQWIIPLSGHWFVETMDGTRVVMGPGDLSFGEDQNTKADAKGHKGHLSGTVGNEPCVTFIVQLSTPSTINEPGHFKGGRVYAPQTNTRAAKDLCVDLRHRR